MVSKKESLVIESKAKWLPTKKVPVRKLKIL
jgi:hypothetical protein